MYDVTSIPLVNLTLATFRKAEFGFLGLTVHTRVQTPRFCGQACNAGTLFFFVTFFRPCLTSWFMVGIIQSPLGDSLAKPKPQATAGLFGFARKIKLY